MTLKDHIDYLKTLPQDLECWVTWDEGGDCHPCEKNQGKVVFVGEEDILDNGHVRFYMHEGEHVQKDDKKVFIVNY